MADDKALKYGLAGASIGAFGGPIGAGIGGAIGAFGGLAADTFGGGDPPNATRQPDGTITDNASGKVVGKWYSDGSMDLGGKHITLPGVSMNRGGFGAGPMGAPGQPDQAAPGGLPPPGQGGPSGMGISGMPSGPNMDMATSDPDKYKLMQMHLAALSQAAYRPEMADARMQGLRQQLGAYSGANNMLGKMYGQGAMMDLGAMGQNPMSQRMQQIGQPNQNGDIGLQPPPMGGPPPVGPGPGGSPKPFGWMAQPPPQGPPPPMGGAVRQAAGMIPGGGPPPPMGGPPPMQPPGTPPGGGMQPPWTQPPPPIAPPPQPPTQRAPMAGMQRGPLTRDSILEALRALGRQ